MGNAAHGIAHPLKFPLERPTAIFRVHRRFGQSPYRIAGKPQRADGQQHMAQRRIDHAAQRTLIILHLAARRCDIQSEPADQDIDESARCKADARE